MPDYLFADAHCHLDRLPGAVEQHILHVTCGYSYDSSIACAKVAQEHENVFLCAGIAPQEAMKHPDIKVKLSIWEDELSRLPKLSAIGEIGLDYHWAKSEQERFSQHEAFIAQLVLAERLGLPVVIHSRDAEEACLEILQNFNLQFLLHCYSGKAETAAAAVATGRGMISIPPLRSKERRQFIEDTPLEKLLAETDAPYIGKLPSDAMESIKMIAEIKGLPVEQVQSATLQNTALFFRIK